MFDVAQCSPDQKTAFDAIVDAVRRRKKAEDDFDATTSVAIMEEIENLIRNFAEPNGFDEDQVYGAAEAIAEKDRWHTIVDQTMEGYEDDFVFDDGSTAAELRATMKDFDWSA